MSKTYRNNIDGSDLLGRNLTPDEVDANFRDSQSVEDQFIAFIATKDIANGFPGLDSTGKIDASQLPPISVSNVYVVADQAARLALTGVHVGDVVKQTSPSGTTYMCSALPSSSLSNWIVIGDTSILITDVTGLQAALDLKGNISDIINDLYDPNYPNNSYIDSVVLENPDGVFYFSVTNFYTCGASNCTSVLYRFNSNNGKLEVIDTNIFGGVIGLYLSSNLQQLALVRGTSGGYCNDASYISTYNLQDFTKQEIDTLTDVPEDNRYFENIAWKNSHDLQFDMVRQPQCGYNIDTTTIWLYNTQTKQVKKIESKTIDHGPVAG